MNKKVIIGEDLALFFELEKSLLQREDIEILVAQNGEQALEMIRKERPHLVVLDLDIARVPGDEVCRQLKADDELKSVPIILMCHANWEEDLVRARSAGCDGIALKPINWEHLLNTVREILSIADRAFPRVKSRLRVLYGPTAGEEKESHTVDLSIGGIFIECEECLPPGTTVELSIKLPEQDKEVRCRGNVSWVNHAGAFVKPMFPPGTGVYFLDLSDEDKARIQMLVDQEIQFAQD